MADRTPVIGVTGPDRGGLIAWLMTALAIRRSGAIARRLTPGRPADAAQLHGLVIGGGTDVDPLHYAEEPLPSNEQGNAASSSAMDWLVGLFLTLFRTLFARHTDQDYDQARDELEKGLIDCALQHQLPVLGICRGTQLINVVLGGSLHQDIGHLYFEGTSNVRSVLPRKSIRVAPGSHLHGILGRDSCTVNALHDQSIKQLGEDVVVSAVEPNGVIQAIEKQDHPFLIGVQWHPEYIPQSRTQQGLFRELARQARLRCLAPAATDP